MRNSVLIFLALFTTTFASFTGLARTVDPFFSDVRSVAITTEIEGGENYKGLISTSDVSETARRVIEKKLGSRIKLVAEWKDMSRDTIIINVRIKIRESTFGDRGMTLPIAALAVNLSRANEQRAIFAPEPLLLQDKNEIARRLNSLFEQTIGAVVDAVNSN